MVEDDDGSGWFDSLTGWLGDKFSGITEGIGGALSSIAEGIGGIIDAVKSIPEKLGSLLSDIWDTVKGIPGAILDGIRSLFLPSDGYFEEKVGALRERFSFFESIVDTVQVFRNFFENNDFTEPPVVTVNLNNADSGTDYGLNAKALDMSWYKPYKPTVDAVLSSMLWVVFVWNVFRDLPGIISGASSGAYAALSISKSEKGGDGS